MTARWQVRALIVVLAALLMLPVLFIFAQDEKELSEARNKTLARWPSVEIFAMRPERYFKSARDWIIDRVGLGITSAGLVRWLKMYLFGDDPTVNLTLNGDYLFLNAWAPDPELRFTLFRQTCRPPDKKAVDGMVKAMEKVQDYFGRYGASVRLVIVPTTPVLYADKLPATVPRSLRSRCLAALGGESAVAEFVNRIDGQSVVYPLTDFIANRDSKSFYPTRSFHFQGESIWLVAQRYFERANLTVPKPAANRSVEIKSEFSRELGFVLPVAINSVPIETKSLLYERVPKGIPGFKKEFSLRYTRASDYTFIRNSASLSDRTALVLSNSFGNGIRANLSLGYKSLFHVNLSQLTQQELNSGELLALLATALKPDDVILVSHDGGAESLLRRVAQSASATNRAAGR